jgi:hypothetical protein
MKFKNWLEAHRNVNSELASMAEDPSCIKGEWIYWPDGKLQNAIRSDKQRGHDHLIRNHYIQKYKNKLFELIQFITSTDCVNKEKLTDVVENDILPSYAYSGNFSFPPRSIDGKNFEHLWAAFYDLMNADIYKNESCENTVKNKVSETIGHHAEYIINELIHGREVVHEAIVDENLIVVRNGNNFEMAKFDRNHLIDCLEAICAKNQNINIKKLKPNLYSPATMETQLNITIYNENGEKQKPTSITVSGLLGGEDPQTEFKGAAAMLPVEPLSQAATMQRDVSRDIWQQRTSENVNFKSYFMETDLSYLLNKEISAMTGLEKHYKVKDGISRHVSNTGSTRFMFHADDKPVSAIQIIENGPEAIVANIYTIPEYRRQGIATTLFRHAKKYFPNLKYSKHLTGEGEKFKDSLD